MRTVTNVRSVVRLSCALFLAGVVHRLEAVDPECLFGSDDATDENVSEEVLEDGVWQNEVFLARSPDGTAFLSAFHDNYEYFGGACDPCIVASIGYWMWDGQGTPVRGILADLGSDDDFEAWQNDPGCAIGGNGVRYISACGYREVSGAGLFDKAIVFAKAEPPNFEFGPIQVIYDPPGAQHVDKPLITADPDTDSSGPDRPRYLYLAR